MAIPLLVCTLSKFARQRELDSTGVISFLGQGERCGAMICPFDHWPECDSGLIQRACELSAVIRHQIGLIFGEVENRDNLLSRFAVPPVPVTAYDLEQLVKRFTKPFR